MRLAVLSRATPAHHPSGGMERHLDQLARGLARSGHEVTVITSALPVGGIVDAPEDGLCFVYVDATVPGRYARGFWNKTAQEVTKRHAQAPFDAIISQSAGAWGVLGQRRARGRPPVLAIMHGTARGEIRTALRAQPYHPKTFAKVLRGTYNFHRYDRVLLPRCQGLVAVSAAVAEQLRSDLPVLGGRIRVIHNGIDLSTVLASDPGRSRTILYVGRILEEKGVFLLLRSFARMAPNHPDARLRFVGGGAVDALRRQVDALGISGQVTIAGAKPHGELPVEYADAGLFAFPTLRDEGLPLSLLEAMAAGLPVLTSSRGGIVEAVRDGREGLLLPTADEDSVTSALRELLDSPDLRVRMGGSARKTVEAHFSESAMIRIL